MIVSIEATVQRIDAIRPEISSHLQSERRSALGQFMTPASVAKYMTSLFTIRPRGQIRLLDPGAGMGALSTAFIQRWQQHAIANSALEITAYEIDCELRKHLEDHLRTCQTDDFMMKQKLVVKVLPYDFIQAVTNSLEFDTQANFTHAFLNPPYKKINNDSEYRKWLRTCGIETVNLYSAFVALAVQLLVDDGELVAIIPRSFCNGPYYKPFRKFILQFTAIEHIHLFNSRDKAFKDDNVLQENIIIKLIRGKKQELVTVSHCADDTFNDYKERVCLFSEIVKPGDIDQFIYIPTYAKSVNVVPTSSFRYKLADLGLEVSTGPVVDFRLRQFLRAEPADDTVPLLYPCHFAGNRITWPLSASKKPNALLLHPETRKWLYPNGFYTVTRRFSSKEEKRRIMASVVRPDAFTTVWLGFENHLNIFHHRKQGLPEKLALGLTVFLNSTMVDEYFRLFNGHTQVNATDLRSLKYPSRDALIELGAWAKQVEYLNQSMIDEHIEGLA